MKSWKGEVIADNSGVWSGNLLRFPTQVEAEAYVLDLAWRWFNVRDTRVMQSEDPPNYTFTGGSLTPIGGQ